MADVFSYYDVVIKETHKLIACGFPSQKDAYVWIEEMHTGFGLDFGELEPVLADINVFLDCGCIISKGELLMCKFKVMQNASH